MVLNLFIKNSKQIKEIMGMFLLIGVHHNVMRIIINKHNLIR